MKKKCGPGPFCGPDKTPFICALSSKLGEKIGMCEDEGCHMPRGDQSLAEKYPDAVAIPDTKPKLPSDAFKWASFSSTGSTNA